MTFSTERLEEIAKFALTELGGLGFQTSPKEVIAQYGHRGTGRARIVFIHAMANLFPGKYKEIGMFLGLRTESEIYRMRNKAFEDEELMEKSEILRNTLVKKFDVPMGPSNKLELSIKEELDRQADQKFKFLMMRWPQVYRHSDKQWVHVWCDDSKVKVGFGRVFFEGIYFYSDEEDLKCAIFYNDKGRMDEVSRFYLTDQGFKKLEKGLEAFQKAVQDGTIPSK